MVGDCAISYKCLGHCSQTRGGGGKGWLFFKYKLKNFDLPQIPEQ